MTEAGIQSICLVPPPGPLVWLHPELDRARQWVRPEPGSAPPPDGAGAMQQVGAMRHAGTMGQAGAALLDHLLASGCREVEVQPGPRGHALRTWLAQALRHDRIHLPQVSPLPPAFSTNPVAGLESLLTEAAQQGDPGYPVHIRSNDDGVPSFRKTEFRPDQVEGNPTRLWVLPLVPGKDLTAHLDRAIQAVSGDPLAFRAAPLVPYFVTRLDLPSGAAGQSETVETRLAPSWWGILPGDAYPVEVRDRFTTLFRHLYPDRIFLFQAMENYALAGVDLYGESLMGRSLEWTGPLPACAPGPGEFAGESTRESTRKSTRKSTRESTRESKPVIIGVCGTDGSGKSSHVAALKDYLLGKGLRVKVRKIYRHGVFHKTVTDLTRQCAGGKNLHLWRLQRIIKVFDSIKFFYSTVEKELEDCDVMIFDRYTYTHFAAGVGRYHHDPFSREMLSLFPADDRTYLLDVPTDEALRRIGTREEKTVDENPYMLARYRHALQDLGDRHDFMVLDARAPFEENRRRIFEDAARLLEASGRVR